MITLMPPTENIKLWSTQIKIGVEGNFKAKFVSNGDTMRPSFGFVWRGRCESCLSVRSRNLLVGHSLVRSCTTLPLAHILGAWMVESRLPARPTISARAKDNRKIVNGGTSVSSLQNQILNNIPVTDNFVPEDVISDFNELSGSSEIFFERDKPIEEPWLVQSSVHSSGADSDASVSMVAEDKIVNFLRNSKLELKSSNQYEFEDGEESKCDNETNNVNRTFDPYATSSERDYPVEEPWLFQPSLSFSNSLPFVVCDASKHVESVNVEVEDSEIHDKLQDAEVNKFQDVQVELSLEEDSSISKGLSASADTPTCSTVQFESSSYCSPISQSNKEKNVAAQGSISTVILINSSLCTMQRIAVLEDGKLVELLLEPVKDNVQCDSVYLGIVTKLVPHMGGAFVNIGSSRPSLMDIKPNRKPFIFPPFRCDQEERELTGSELSNCKEHAEICGNEHNLDDAEDSDDPEEHEIGDASVQYMHDDFEEQEVEDDFDVMEDLKENVNGSVPGHGVEVDLVQSVGHLGENEDHVESQTDREVLSPDILKLQPSHLQDLKDDKVVRANENKWAPVRKGTKIIVQVVKEGLGTKGPTLTAYPKLRSRFWVLSTQSKTIGISKKIAGVERTRLRVIAKTLQPKGYGLTVRTVASGHSLEELQKDLERLLSTWKVIMEHAKSAALAADEGVKGAIPVLLHRAMGQTLSVVQDYFSEKVKCMIVDSPRIYHEVTNYLQEIAPDLCDRVELYSFRTPLFDAYNIEEELNNILSKRVPLSNGGYLVIEQTEALVSIDVNGGHCMLGDGTSQEKAILDVNLAAAKQIARELRLRDIGGIIVVDFIDMADDSNKRLVYEEVKKAVERDRSMVKVSELSRHGLMEITRKRVRPSVTFMVSEPCSCCHATGRVEALETSYSKIEHELCRLLATMDKKPDPGNPKLWPKFVLRVDRYMCNYLMSGKRTRLAILSSSLKAWILLKVARGFTRGAFELKPLSSEKDNKNRHAAITMLRATDVGSGTPKGKVTIFPVKKWRTRTK